jgi:hypothetical protein
VQTDAGDAYTSPECARRCLVGVVEGHPVKADGTCVRTSQVVASAGRVVTTASGTRYLLGGVDPAYAAYLTLAGVALDDAEPVRP